MPPTDPVRAEHDRILASPIFAKSPRMTRFLRFVAEQTLAGKGGQLKEYTVAVEVFGKKTDFDPQADSTVRTEAGKLRARLERYYETDGREDAVVISIPKGSYVPLFADRRNGTDANRPGVLPWGRVVAASTAVAVAYVGAGLLWWATRSPAQEVR
jgi:hypothetical protein